MGGGASGVDWAGSMFTGWGVCVGGLSQFGVLGEAEVLHRFVGHLAVEAGDGRTSFRHADALPDGVPETARGGMINFEESCMLLLCAPNRRR